METITSNGLSNDGFVFMDFRLINCLLSGNQHL